MSQNQNPNTQSNLNPTTQSSTQSSEQLSTHSSTQEGLKILGFDIGVASIGWAFVEGGELKDCGVRIFTKAENPKDGSSLALPRREARGARRRLARRKGRLNALKVLICKEFGLNRSDYLANAGELPKAYIASKETKSPYQLRAESLNRKLSADEFARVILHIAKHRGYGNKHAKESSDDDSGKVKKAISENAKIMSEKGYTTAGQYLYGEFYQKERNEQEIQARVETLKAYYKSNKVKAENQNKNKLERQSPNQFTNIRNKRENYARCLAQSELQKELEIIFAKQREFGLNFSDEFKEKVLETAFLQRPLKNLEEKVGLCTFYGDEKGGKLKRAPKDSLSAIEFVALTRIINTLANITKRSGEVYSADKVREILAIVLDKGEITYKNLRKVIALDDKLQFPKDSKLDYAKEDAEKAKAIEFSKLKAFRKALGGSFEGFSRAELDTIATDIALTKSKDELKAKLANYQSLNDEQREKLSELSFDKFIDLSFKALEAILPLMRGDSGECKRYDEAWREAGLVEVAKKTQKGDSLPPLIQYEQNLANPVVARALAEYRKVLNALLKKYGKVHKIHLEFTREIGSTKKERLKKEKEQRENFTANESARKNCKEIFGDSYSENDLLKVKLWREQGSFCAYSGKPISPDNLKDPTMVEIEHIYPKSRSFDNSYMNKVLVFTSTNRNKRNQTPYEFWGKDPAKKEQWDFIVSFSKRLPKPKRDRIINQNFKGRNAGFQANSIEEEDEIKAQGMPKRHIVGTGYIAKLARDYTQNCLKFLDFPSNTDESLISVVKERRHIEVISGNLTAMLRHYWGLHTILNKNDDKDRSNHLHHAIDAITLAYANAKHIKAYADFKRSREEHKKVEYIREEEDSTYRKANEYADDIKYSKDYKTRYILREPCENFRAKVKRKILGQSLESRENNTTINSESVGEKASETINGIFVSKPPRKRARGALHEETFKSVDDEKLLKAYGGKEGVNRAIKLGKVRQIGSKIADNGTMVRVDIFRHKVNGKFYGVPIYTMDFALGILPNKAVVGGKDKSGVIKDWLEMDSNYEFCFSLFKDDLILVQKKEMSKAELCYFVNFVTSNAQINVEKHDNHFATLTENQKLLFSNATPKEVKGLSIGIQNLKVFEKWQVSPLGEVSKAEFREREPITLKSTPKSHKDSSQG